MKDKAVFSEMLIQQKPVRFQVDCEASANILPYKHVGNVDLAPLLCGMAPRSSLWGFVLCRLQISPKQCEVQSKVLDHQGKSNSTSGFEHHQEDGFVNRA